MGFSRKEYCSGSPCPSPRDLPNPGIEPASPVAPSVEAHSLPLSLCERLVHQKDVLSFRSHKLFVMLFFSLAVIALKMLIGLGKSSLRRQ